MLPIRIVYTCSQRETADYIYYPYWQYTNLFIFRFVSVLCLRSTLYVYFSFKTSSFIPIFAFDVPTIAGHFPNLLQGSSIEIVMYFLLSFIPAVSITSPLFAPVEANSRNVYTNYYLKVSFPLPIHC